MKNRSLVERILFNVGRFIVFFLLICFVVTSTMLLFLDGMELDEAVLRRNALLTFLNVFFLALLFCLFDAIRRHLTVDRHLRRILDALDQIAEGNYGIRLAGGQIDLSKDGFHQISLGINRLAQELSGVETLRSDFIANVSHELKTPLSAVHNYATLLGTSGLTEEKKQEYTEAICQTTARLADLVSNILKLNKLENQQIYPDLQTFDLGEQLCRCLLEFEAAWEKKGLTLDCRMQEGIYVEADPELLNLVWANLFSNAIKFTPAGGKITVRLWQEGIQPCISVSDTGCGMTSQTGSHIFEKFYQGDTAHATQGNGLGLALVKRVMDITGGSISVSSTPGKGSCFTVRLKGDHHGAN